MKRLLTLALLACILAVTMGATRSPTPYIPTAACTWHNNGMIITEPDGSRMMCLCERVAAIDEWWCVWQDLPQQAKPNRYRIRHKFRNVRYYNHPRIGAWLA